MGTQAKNPTTQPPSSAPPSLSFTQSNQNKRYFDEYDHIVSPDRRSYKRENEAAIHSNHFSPRGFKIVLGGSSVKKLPLSYSKYSSASSSSSSRKKHNKRRKNKKKRRRKKSRRKEREKSKSPKRSFKDFLLTPVKTPAAINAVDANRDPVTTPLPSPLVNAPLTHFITQVTSSETISPFTTQSPTLSETLSSPRVYSENERDAASPVYSARKTWRSWIDPSYSQSVTSQTSPVSEYSFATRSPSRSHQSLASQTSSQQPASTAQSFDVILPGDDQLEQGRYQAARGRPVEYVTQPKAAPSFPQSFGPKTSFRQNLIEIPSKDSATASVAGGERTLSARGARSHSSRKSSNNLKQWLAVLPDRP